MANVALRNVDEVVFRRFKVRAVEEGLSLGRAVTQALFEWAARREIKPKRSIFEFKPVSLGKSSKSISREIDEIAYGAKK
ncbi:MAG: hypothetical protein WC792_05055 [Candidatus Micrarchaeia archaeon]|jgi:hypothetical protein